MAVNFFKPWTPYAYLAVPMALFGLFFFWPLLWTMGMSTLDYRNSLYQPTFVGLSNYTQLLTSREFQTSLWNSLLFTLGVVPAMVTLPLVMALLVNHALPGITLIRALLYLPVVTSLVVVGIAWKWLYAEGGLLNYLLSFLGMPKIAWLAQTETALLAIAIVVVWKGLAYYMMMYLAHLQQLEPELYQAAELDGASLLQKHWYLTLPSLVPAMAMVAMISTIGSLKTFTEMYVMTRGGPAQSTQTWVYLIYKQAFEQLDIGVASASGILLMLVLLFLSLLQHRVVSIHR